MDKDKIFETIVGFVVIIFVVGFLFFINNFYNIKTSSYINLIAKFDNADGINVGTDIKISGIKVGKVASVGLDKNVFRAIIGLNVDSKIPIPIDSIAMIRTNGLMGSRYIEIEIGGDDKFMQNNYTFRTTQSSLLIEDLIGKFILNIGKK